MCPRCMEIIEYHTTGLESLLEIADNPSLHDEAMDEFWKWFECKWCVWDGNLNRLKPLDERQLHPYVKGWVIADLKHQLQHAFPTDFLPSRRLRNLQAHERAKRTREIIEQFQKLMEAEMQKAIPNDCTSIEEVEKAWETYIAADWKAHRAEGSGYVKLRASDGSWIPFGPDGHPHMEGN